MTEEHYKLKGQPIDAPGEDPTFNVVLPTEEETIIENKKLRKNQLLL